VSDGSGTGNLADLMGADDPQLEHTLDMEAVWTHWVTCRNASSAC